MRFQKGVLDYLFYSKGVKSVSKITILREPAALFESTFGYLKANTQAFKRANGDINSFLNEPEKFYYENEGGQFYIFGHNHMMFDLGFSPELKDENEILSAIESVKKSYDLVMITEYFEESMILLKHLLCLGSGKDGMQDDDEAYKTIAYLISNARDEQTKVNLSDSQKNKIYEWNKADTLLYRAMNETFWEHVRNFGLEKMAEEKLRLNIVISKIEEKCFLGETSDQSYWGVTKK